ncbi:hypothetical protein GF382_01840 [Candidatus Falkowbacteria bacterium]|nr:hypothetical protein [Candidatus Falkowbacteria bacterium]
MREKQQQVFEQIKKAEKILITFPSLWNGDAISSALALSLLLKKLGKKADIMSAKNGLADYLSTPSSFFSFLPEFNSIKTEVGGLGKFVISLDTSKTKIKKIRYRKEDGSIKFFITPEQGKFKPEDVKASDNLNDYDLIITLDSPDLESIGELFEKNTNFFYNTPIINIDHHAANEEYGQINIIDINSVSTSEVVFSLIGSENEELIDNDISTCLLTGIVIKTKNFKTANVTPDTLFSTSKLIAKEARRDEIVNNLFRSRNLRVLKLWGRILARLSSLNNNKIIWSTINEIDFIKTETSSMDLSDIIEELMINIPEAEVIMIFYENPSVKDESGRPQAEILIHTPKNMNLSDIVREYRPQGTDKFIKIEAKKALKELKTEMINMIDKKIKALG